MSLSERVSLDYDDVRDSICGNLREANALISLIIESSEAESVLSEEMINQYADTFQTVSETLEMIEKTNTE